MEGTKYMSSTGKTRNTKMLAEDIQKYYREIGLNEVASMYQIQRTLLGSKSDFSIVCQIAQPSLSFTFRKADSECTGNQMFQGRNTRGLEPI